MKINWDMVLQGLLGVAFVLCVGALAILVLPITIIYRAFLFCVNLILDCIITALDCIFAISDAKKEGL